MNRGRFAPGEWYHCYNRGVEKRIVFSDEQDYARFIELLYLSNTIENIRRSEVKYVSTEDILNIPRAEPLVAIGAYCLMPNHFHLLLNMKRYAGITRFMRKLMTGYTMYFNLKNARTGNLFTKPFKSRHVADDRYFQQVVRYIHCNPAELFEPRWKEGSVQDISALTEKLVAYPHSSLGAFTGRERRRGILDAEVFDIYEATSPARMVYEAAEYYADLRENLR